jgi:ABC-type antimicrobial peptide transport system permease subunit
LYGWDWDKALFSGAGYGSVDPAKAHALLDHDATVMAWTGLYFGSVELDGRNIPVLGQEANAAVTPPILSGRQVKSGDEVVVGPTTLASLNKRIGDTVSLAQGDRAVPLRIVGTATFPSLGIGHGTHTSLGEGALVTYDRIPGVARNVTNNPSTDGPPAILVRFQPEVAASAATRRLADIADQLNTPANNVDVLAVQRPAEIVDYRNMGQAPAVLAGGLAGAALLSLGLTLAASVRRRRRDLALLKGLGFSRGQLARTIAWQATVTVLAGLAVGVPVGMAAGRWLWILFARQLHVVPQASVPLVLIAGLAAGIVVLANAVAAVPGRIAARVSTAALLRAE